MLFSKFERLVATRYLRAKRKEGFISVITGFAFTGIALGVATLIIVMSVMNGFRHELLSRILGINGHIGIMSPLGYPFNNYKEAIKELADYVSSKTLDIGKNIDNINDKALESLIMTNLQISEGLISGVKSA